MTRSNFHTHTLFCDGTASPIEYVEAALKEGVSHLGFSGHAPLLHKSSWNIDLEKLPDYVESINELKKDFSDKIQIFLGLEADYIPGVSKKFSSLKSENGLDYIIGSVHLVKGKDTDELWFIDGPDSYYVEGLKKVFNNNIRKAIEAFFYQTWEMIETQDFDIIGHFDKIKMNNKERFFSLSDQWYQKLVLETLDLIKKKNCIVEINCRGIYKNRHSDWYPGKNLFAIMAEMDIPVTFSSDAHKPEEIALLYNETLTELYKAGYKSIKRLTISGRWEDVPIENPN